MPMPSGTYLRVQQNERSRFSAEQSRQALTCSRANDLKNFYGALDRISESELDRLRRYLAAVAHKFSRGEPTNPNDKTRATVSEAVGKVREMLEKVQDLRQLEGQLGVPIPIALRAPALPSTAGFDLSIVIALLQMLETLIRLRRRNSRA